MMIHLGFLLHAYQPPTQPQHIIDTIFKESYLAIVEFLEHHSTAFLSLDIAKSLAERLPLEFLGRIKTLYKDKRIELVNTAAYHPILPLVTSATMERQLILNEEAYRMYFMESEENIPGVFPPELAIAPWIFPTISRLRRMRKGYQWILADDGPFEYERRRQCIPPQEEIPATWIPTSNNIGVLLRSRLWSERIAQQKYHHGAALFRELIQNENARTPCRMNQDTFLILAVDWEIFGHHHRHAIEKFLHPFFEELRAYAFQCCLSSMHAIYSLYPHIPWTVPAGSWSTSEKDFLNANYFPFWLGKENVFHWHWYTLLTKVQNYAAEHQTDIPLQELIDKVVYSCTPWWQAQGNKIIPRWAFPMINLIIADIKEPDTKQEILHHYTMMKMML